MENIKTFIKQDTTANPGPLGLSAFGLSTILLNLHNAGLFGMDTMILAMGIFMGGIVQVMVGKMEWQKGNLFGTMAFTSYGIFWLSFAFLMMLPKMGLGEAPSSTAMGYFLVVWGVLTLGFLVATLKISKYLSVLFGSALILFALLAIANFTGSHLVHTIAGIEGVFCGSLALYIAMAELLETVYGRKVLPVS